MVIIWSSSNSVSGTVSNSFLKSSSPNSRTKNIWVNSFKLIISSYYSSYLLSDIYFFSSSITGLSLFESSFFVSSFLGSSTALTLVIYLLLISTSFLETLSSIEHPGSITSTNYGVNMLFFISDSLRNSFTSR